MLAAPEPGLTPAKIIERAVALRPLLRAEQEDNDRRGHYSEAVEQALTQGGFYRILQPRRFGGYEFDLDTFIKAVMELSRGHPASAWCFALAGSHGYVLASHWPDEVQRELFGASGEFRCAMTAGPTGSCAAVEGGYRISGLWPFASGIPVCTHFLASTLARNADGAAVPLYFFVPRSDFSIEPDWGGEQGMGMQGSGSNSVRITDAFVPARRTTGTNLLSMSSEHHREGTPGTQLHGNPLYLGVLVGWFSCEFGAILTGAARAALDEFEQLLRTRKMTFSPQLRMHDPHNHVTLGEALSRADAAEALTLAATELYAEQCRRWARTGEPITAADTLRVWSISREGCRAACEAVEMLFRAAGASVSKRGQPLQRYFRDVQMYRVHVQSQPTFPAIRGQVALGLPLPPPFNG